MPPLSKETRPFVFFSIKGQKSLPSWAQPPHSEAWARTHESPGLSVLEWTLTSPLLILVRALGYTLGQRGNEDYKCNVIFIFPNLDNPVTPIRETSVLSPPWSLLVFQSSPPEPPPSPLYFLLLERSLVRGKAINIHVPLEVLCHKVMGLTFLGEVWMPPSTQVPRGDVGPAFCHTLTPHCHIPKHSLSWCCFWSVAAMQ